MTDRILPCTFEITLGEGVVVSGPKMGAWHLQLAGFQDDAVFKACFPAPRNGCKGEYIWNNSVRGVSGQRLKN